MISKKFKSVIGLALVVALFMIASYLVQKNSGFFYSYLNMGGFGMVLFVFIMILSIVIAPVSSMPLLPIASGMWSWQIAGILSIIGWTIGAVIAFLLAREYGVNLVGKVLPMD